MENNFKISENEAWCYKVTIQSLLDQGKDGEALTYCRLRFSVSKNLALKIIEEIKSNPLK